MIKELPALDTIIKKTKMITLALLFASFAALAGAETPTKAKARPKHPTQVGPRVGGGDRKPRPKSNREEDLSLRNVGTIGGQAR
jgi:hypothetical protein